ncbi:MAG: hypothetical protein IJQ31_00230 [Thermoguttaceae bacterium]|nr:hypothetical protein [Thermoguttaceae bacterium]
MTKELKEKTFNYARLCIICAIESIKFHVWALGIIGSLIIGVAIGSGIPIGVYTQQLSILEGKGFQFDIGSLLIGAAIAGGIGFGVYIWKVYELKKKLQMKDEENEKNVAIIKGYQPQSKHVGDGETKKKVTKLNKKAEVGTVKKTNEEIVKKDGEIEKQDTTYTGNSRNLKEKKEELTKKPALSEEKKAKHQKTHDELTENDHSKVSSDTSPNNKSPKSINKQTNKDLSK